MLVLRYASCVYAHSIPDLYQPIQRFAGEIGNPAAGDMEQTIVAPYNTPASNTPSGHSF